MGGTTRFDPIVLKLLENDLIIAKWTCNELELFRLKIKGTFHTKFWFFAIWTKILYSAFHMRKQHQCGTKVVSCCFTRNGMTTELHTMHCKGLCLKPFLMLFDDVFQLLWHKNLHFSIRIGIMRALGCELVEMIPNKHIISKWFHSTIVVNCTLEHIWYSFMLHRNVENVSSSHRTKFSQFTSVSEHRTYVELNENYTSYFVLKLISSVEFFFWRNNSNTNHIS